MALSIIGIEPLVFDGYIKSLSCIFVATTTIFLIAFNWPVSKLTPVIYTADGPVQGIVSYSSAGYEYWSFLGIPYALPLTESGKYLPSKPAKPWKDVKLTNKYSPRCLQYDAFLNLKTFGSMDCLHLNVFVHKGAKTSSSKLKPVIVYNYGGGFVQGATQIYQPDYYMDYDIVLVIMNYRLGPFGFLNLEGKSGPKGNMALWDTNLALKWVKKNIKRFGGDPDNVTLMGTSAGGVMTHFHVLSPHSRGLISRAIIQSASALAPWAFYSNPKHIAKEYAKRLGCSVDNDTALRHCFENTDWKVLVGNQNTLVDPLLYTDLFSVSVDGVFLNDTPINILKSGNFAKIPIMFGVNAAEGVMGTAKFEGRPHLIQQLEKDWAQKFSNLMLFDKQLKIKAARKIRKEYFGNKSFLENVDSFMKNLTLLGSESQFWHPVQKAAKLHMKHGAPTYLYYFNYTSAIYTGTLSLLRSVTTEDFWPPEINQLWSNGIDWIKEFVFGIPVSHKYGAGHGDDAPIQWNIEGLTKYLSKPDENFRKDMLKSIVDFASGTVPMTFRNKHWPKYNGNEESVPLMVLDNRKDPGVIWDLLGKREKFWDSIFNGNSFK